MWGQARDCGAADLEAGTALYRANCSACHGPEGDGVAGIDFRRGQFRHVSSDGEILRVITNGIPGTAMPPANFTREQASAVVAYVRSLHATPDSLFAAGDPNRGRAIFEGPGECLTCHRVRDKGSRVGPNLTGIGGVRTAADLERSLLDAGAGILPQNRYVRAVTRNGETITGRRLNEDTFTVQLIDGNERLVSLSKSELREYTILKTSSMPTYRGKVTPGDLADLIAYLLSLKGDGTP